MRTFTAESMTSLADLDGQLPESAEDEWVHAVTTLMRIDDEATAGLPDLRTARTWTTITPTLPTVGTGFGTGALPAVNLPDIVLPTLVLPSVDAAGPAARAASPSPARPSVPAAGRPPASPPATRRRCPPTLPTGVADRPVSPGCPPRASRPSALPTAAATSAAVVVCRRVDLTQLIDNLTGGPSCSPSTCPRSTSPQLLGGVLGSVLPTPVTDPLGDLARTPDRS